MNSLSSSMFPFLFLFLFSLSWLASADRREDFIQCLESQNSISISKVIHTPINSSYLSVLKFSIRNGRFDSSGTPKPLIIVTPVNVSQIQDVVICSKKHGLQIRVRSGGHDFEGLSYVSTLPFVIVDLINLRKVTVNVKNTNAWVEAGATIGELYHGISKKSRTLAFPAGVCPTVGVGGHFSGGGMGMIFRKYGTAADHIVDARLIDAQGKLHDRESMGEDLFWAIRGGGGNTFGIVVAWKLKLVPVPPIVTGFSVKRTLEQGATKIVHRWQSIASKLHEDIFTRVFLNKVADSSLQGQTTIQATFATLFLGQADRLVSLMQESFPELGLVKKDCIQMSWIQSELYFNGFPINTSLNVLLNRTPIYNMISVKGKSDFVKEPLPETALEGICRRIDQLEVGAVDLQFTAFGGRMNDISESSLPFPHRAGILYLIEYLTVWREERSEESGRYISWMRKLHKYMTPYVSKNPRESYVNYRDLDLGINKLKGNTSYKKASIWGKKYFKNNFDRLVNVKTKVDPANFFRHEQSIPPLYSR